MNWFKNFAVIYLVAEFFCFGGGLKNGGHIMEQRKIIGKILQVILAIVLGLVAYWVLIVLTGTTPL
ncbi:hypothetical protein AKL21_06755 [Enterococcus canintestini]|uniref:Uncharacterized protein n=1 Tax=Enterococcus canintestini TaxID=317010 RepID=A0A267HRH5_9ENTE|nr:hypothetical protein AKL21_06755 [Enterococcus canintestini]